MLVHKLLVDLAPPFVTAKSWAICDGRTGEILFGKLDDDGYPAKDSPVAVAFTKEKIKESQKRSEKGSVSC